MDANSLKQAPTPLNQLYFSEFNRGLVQRAIRETFKRRHGLAIDYQKDEDVYALMRSVFVLNEGDHFTNIHEQVRAMNTIVINNAVTQIKSGVAQYLHYIKDIETAAEPIARPVNTSTHGKKMDYNDKIGIN
jgi:hypothetical protein